MRILLLAVALILGAGLFGQSDHNTNTYFNAGLGVSAWGIPVYIGYDTPVARDINIAGRLSYQRRTTGSALVTGGERFVNTIVGVNLRGLYYIDRVADLPKEFDAYGGVSLGYYIWNVRYTGDDDFTDFNSRGSGGLGLGLFIGGRYHIDDSWSLQVEGSGGNVLSGGTIGVSKKL